MPGVFPDIDIPIAYFVTDHGYGHATRSVAVMAAIAEQLPGVCFEVFTTAPKWLFEDQNFFRFNYHREKTDVGLIQSTPFEADLKATIAELSRFLPFEPSRVTRIGSYLHKINARLVICDIAPIGISIANQAGIPAALIENFTWDWIYAQYHDRHDRLKRFSEYLRSVFAAAPIRIQVEPFCEPHPADLRTEPVCRPITAERSRVRESLGLSPSGTMVLVSFGGLGHPRRLLDTLPQRDDVTFVVPGCNKSRQTPRNVILLPSHSGHPHPDLVNAADAVIGKAGYSTLAEVYQAGVPFGYLPRNDFRESTVLENFIELNIPSIMLDWKKVSRGNWDCDLTKLLALSRVKRNRTGGARQVARHLMAYI